MTLRSISMMSLALAVVATAPAASLATPITVNNADADFDRWMYPFNFTPGARSTASTFAALNNPGFDERDGQFLIGFDTAAAGVPTGLNPSDYQVGSLVVTATHNSTSFTYDPTYDSYTTYLAGGTDPDAGRPIILTGAGLRDGYTSFGFAGSSGTPVFEEDEAFGGSGPGVRDAFAADFDSSGNLRDISNNVGTNFVTTTGFDGNFWAAGTTGLAAGATVSGTQTFTFDMTPALDDPDILQYVQQGFSSGGLFFAITSLSPASQPGEGGPTPPNFQTSDAIGGTAPQASYEVTIVPEPASATLLGIGAMLLGLRQRRRRSA